MAKLNAAYIDSWLTKIPPELRLFLIYGPEEGNIQLTLQKLQKQLLIGSDPQFDLAMLDLKQIRDDSALLNDEMQSRSLLGGRKVIVITNVSGVIRKDILDLLKNPKGNAFCIIVGDDMKPATAIRKICEEQAHAIAIACYKDDPTQLAQFIRQQLLARNVQFENDVPALLASFMPANRMLILQEIEKLSLYALNQKIIADHIIETIVDASEMKFDDLCLAVAARDSRKIATMMQNMNPDDANFMLIIRVLARYIMRLIEVKYHMSSNLNAEQAVAKLKPPVFFKAKDSLIMIAKKTGLEDAFALLEKLTHLEINCKKGVISPELLMRHFLIAAK